MESYLVPFLSPPDYQMSRQETLNNIFAGYVNQQTLEEAAEQMAFVSSDHPQIHEQFFEPLNWAIESLEGEADRIKEAINRSGYGAKTTEEASDLLRELLRCYLEAFDRAQRP